MKTITLDNFDKEWQELDETDRINVMVISRNLYGKFWDRKRCLVLAFNDYLADDKNNLNNN